MRRTGPAHAALLAAAALALAGATPAVASPFGAVLAGSVVGGETGVGGAIGGRAGLRLPRGAARWGGFVEVSKLYFLAFGPHGHIDGVHALLAGDWTRGRGRRGHLFAGVGLDHWRRPGTEHDEDLDTTVIAGALGAGVGLGPVRVDLEGSLTLVELARATDSRSIGPQLVLLVSLGRP